MLDDKDITRIADAVIARIEQMKQIDEIAAAVVQQLKGVTATSMQPSGFALAACSPAVACVPPGDPYGGCPDPNYSFTCAGTQLYCSVGDGHSCTGTNFRFFQCSYTTTPYTCSAGYTCDSGAVIDFNCKGGGQGAGFNCPGTFNCQANHVFACGPVSGAAFTCGTFTCKAGTGVVLPCGKPSTGAYSFDDPGDFTCICTFQCDASSGSQVRCLALDDFTCDVAGGTYTCTGGFSCSGQNGSFDCQASSSGFTCAGGTFGGCVPASAYSAS